MTITSYPILYHPYTGYFSRYPEAMRNLFSLYARVFNKKYKRRGHLFGGPYRQAVCLDDSYLLSVSLYIHANPVRAGIVGAPQDYRWSSIRLYW